MVFAIAAVAMILLSVRPFRIRPWIWPVLGAVIVVTLGFEPVAAAWQAIARQWNVLLFILGLMGLAAAAEESGAFAWLTAVALEHAGGSRRRLFVLLFLTGAALTLVLSNDATAIVLTPVVYRAIAKRGGDPMPFLFGCTFVADTASFGLPFANPANVLILPNAQFGPYVAHLGPPQVLAIALNLAIFLAVFRTRLRGQYEVEPASPPSGPAVRTLVVAVLVAIAYVVVLTMRWPLGPVAVAGALVALVVARVAPGSAVRHISWSTFALLFGLFALLDAVARAGFEAWSMQAMTAAQQWGSLALNAAAGGGAALFSNIFNNLPVAVVSSYLVAHAPEHVAYPLIAGVDLGPNLTMTGSIATILWSSMLRKRGVHVSALEYIRLGIIVVPATLGVTVLWLWLVP
jgi:arsenical pump membrane protein